MHKDIVLFISPIPYPTERVNRKKIKPALKIKENSA